MAYTVESCRYILPFTGIADVPIKTVRSVSQCPGRATADLEFGWKSCVSKILRGLVHRKRNPAPAFVKRLMDGIPPLYRIFARSTFVFLGFNTHSLLLMLIHTKQKFLVDSSQSLGFLLRFSPPPPLLRFYLEIEVKWREKGFYGGVQFQAPATIILPYLHWFWLFLHHSFLIF